MSFPHSPSPCSNISWITGGRHPRISCRDPLSSFPTGICSPTVTEEEKGEEQKQVLPTDKLIFLPKLLRLNIFFPAYFTERKTDGIQKSAKQLEGLFLLQPAPGDPDFRVRRTFQRFLLIRQPGEGARHPNPRPRSPERSGDNADDSFVRQIKEVAHEGALLAAAL